MVYCVTRANLWANIFIYENYKKKNAEKANNFLYTPYSLIITFP